MRRLASLLLFSLLVFAPAPRSSAADAPSGRLNVLFIATDDQNTDLGC